MCVQGGNLANSLTTKLQLLKRKEEGAGRMCDCSQFWNFVPFSRKTGQPLFRLRGKL